MKNDYLETALMITLVGAAIGLSLGLIIIVVSAGVWVYQGLLT